MNTLQEIQDNFQNYICNREKAIFESIHPPQIGTKEQRLDVYYQAYRLRLREALSAHYPMLCRYLGKSIFSTLCDDYIATHPSHFRSISCVGHKMHCFLKRYPPTQDKPYLSELALFEWTLIRVFEAKDCAPLRVSDFLDLSPESWASLCFHQHPSLYCLTFFWNTVPLWKQFQHTHERLTPQYNPQPTTWVVWRKDFTSYFSSLSEPETSALSLVLSGQTFGTVCQELSSYFPENEVSAYAATLLKNWVVQEFFTSLFLGKNALE